MLKDTGIGSIEYNPDDNFYTKWHLWKLGILDEPPVLDAKGIRFTLVTENAKESDS